MDLSGMMTYVAALSVSTERVTEFIKRIPRLSDFLSAKLPPTPTPAQQTKEDIRVICVHLLAVVIGIVLCYFFPDQLAPDGHVPADPTSKFGWCLLFGILASGGSSFWNSALDTFRGVKTKMGA
jgi:hypothetical protein